MYHLLLLLIFANGQTTDPTTPYDSVCVTSTFATPVDGRYSYLHWDSIVNDSVYYSNETLKYIYPLISQNNDNHQYIISDRILTPNNTQIQADSICVMNASSNILFDINDCFENWISKVNNTWIKDLNMRVINCMIFVLKEIAFLMVWYLME
eukprot:124065_1